MKKTKSIGLMLGLLLLFSIGASAFQSLTADQCVSAKTQTTASALLLAPLALGCFAQKHKMSEWKKDGPLFMLVITGPVGGQLQSQTGILIPATQNTTMRGILPGVGQVQGLGDGALIAEGANNGTRTGIEAVSPTLQSAECLHSSTPLTILMQAE